MRLACFGAALWVGWTAGCADGGPVGEPAPARTAPITSRAVISGTPPRGVRVDLTAQAHHARALLRQPDGSYRTICADAPDGGLRAREQAGR
jgi:hypothetical protein